MGFPAQTLDAGRQPVTIVCLRLLSFVVAVSGTPAGLMAFEEC